MQVRRAQADKTGLNQKELHNELHPQREKRKVIEPI